MNQAVRQAGNLLQLCCALTQPWMAVKGAMSIPKLCDAGYNSPRLKRRLLLLLLLQEVRRLLLSLTLSCVR